MAKLNMTFNEAMTRIANYNTKTNTRKEQLEHILMLGNCLDKLKQIADNSVHLVITDPPYFLDGLGDDWDNTKIQNKQKKAGVIGGLPVGMKFDPKQGKKFQEFYSKVSEEIYRVLCPGGFFLSFSQPRLFHRMSVAVEDAGFEIRDQYIWYYTQRSQMKAFSQDHFVDKMSISEKEKTEIKKKLNGRKTPQLRPQFESILMAQKPRDGTFVENWLKWETGLIDTTASLDGKSPSTIMGFEKPIKESYNSHLTVKPVVLIQHLIRIFSKNGQVVLDPFLGSGTTAIASEKEKRKCIGIEINPEYMEITEQRLLDIGGNYTDET